MGATRDITPERDATEVELQQYDLVRDRIQQLDRSNTYDSSDPNQRLMHISFDGTRNDRESSDPKNIHTNPDLLEGMVKESDRVDSQYFHGVATRSDNVFEEAYEAITGDGSEARAKAAYDYLVEKVKAWHSEDPNVEIHLATTGFSRGTGSQRHFANLVDERGIPDSSGNGYLIPPGGVHQDVMLMYDSVVTGQEDVLNLSIPDSVANAVHLTADHENRINFDSASIVDPLNPYDLGVLEMGLPGAHSDVGGNYGYKGLSARSLGLGHELLSLMGVPLKDVHEDNLPISTNTTIHDSGSLIDLANWENGEREVDIYGNPERRPDITQEAKVEHSFLGLHEADWKELSKTFSNVQQIEDFGDEVSAMLAAYEAGDDWEVFESSVDLLSSLHNIGATNISGYLGVMGDYSSDIKGVSSLVSAIGDFKDLEEALRTGDGWGVAESATAMLEDGFDAYNALNNIESLDTYSQDSLDAAGFSSKGGAVAGAASSLVSLGLNVQELVDAFDEGDTIACVQAALGVVESATCAYVAVASAQAALTGATIGATANMVGTALPMIGMAVGIAQGILAIADGDIEGGVEQIAITVATYALCTIPVFGWAAALALQLGSATRGCDGRIIDKENIIDFSDDIALGGGMIAEATMDSIEKPAEWLTNTNEAGLYLSGFSLEMYEDIGVDIPEDMRGDFEYVQLGIEANSPLMVTKYFQNLEDMSLADIWESTYISQSIVATIEQIKNLPDSIKSWTVDGPEMAIDMVKAMTDPENIVTMVKNIFGADDPPEASASFTLDAEGSVVMAVSGDSGMQEAATAYGESVVGLMENYRDTGGQLMVDGNLPTLKVVGGEDTQMSYVSDSGGQTIVFMENMSSAKILGILAARDHGDQLDSAIRVSTDIQGNIDISRVDSTMAGLGFAKNGINYTFGETRERYGSSTGSGVIRGGGNDGPEGQHFIAKSSDFTSLPLRQDQLPTQQMGKINKIIGLNNMFSGAGAELLAMAMAVPGGLLALASPVLAQEDVDQINSAEGFQKPMDGVERIKYLQGQHDLAQPVDAVDRLFEEGTFAGVSTGAYCFQETITFTGLGTASHGTVNLQPDGQAVLFTPDQNYTGANAWFHSNVTDDSEHVCTTDDYQFLQHAA